MSDFLPAVVHAFQSLLDKGLLKVECSVYDREAFGNAAVVLSGRNLRIRMIRDRGQVFAEAASSSFPTDWFPLQMVLRAVSVTLPMPAGLLTSDEAAQLVEQSFSQLDNGLANDRVAQTRAKLAEIERVSTRKVTERFRGNA